MHNCAGLQSYQIISLSFFSTLLYSKTITVKMRLPDVTNTLSHLTISNPHRVLIVGCAYGGISAVLNLLDYSQGKARPSVYPGPDFKGTKSTRGIEITVIDERDGYCASLSNPTLAERFSSFATGMLHIVTLHEVLVLIIVLCSPLCWCAACTCHAQVYEPYVEAVQPSERAEA